MAYIPPLNGGRINATISGNTAGAGSLVSTGTLTLAGGNNITLSQAGNAITISGANGGGTMGLYGAGNTTQNSSTTVDVRSVSLNGLGAMSVGYSNGSVQLSAPVVSSVSATGALSLSVNGSTVSIGVPAVSFGMSNIGNTAGTSGTASNQLILAGGNNVTLSQSTDAGGNTITISTPNIPSGSINFSAGTTSNNLASVAFSDGNGVSFGLNAGTVTGSVATNYAASTHSHGNPTLNLTNLSGTTASASNGLTLSLSAAAPGAGVGLSAGTQSVGTGTVNFANSNGITFGMSGSNQITASHNGITSQSNQSMGLYGLGNTTQNSSTTLDARSISLNGLGAMSVGYSGGSVQLSAPQTSSLAATGALSLAVNAGTISLGVPAFSAGVATNSTVSNQVILTAGNNITLSQSTDASGATISINGATGGGGGGGIALANSQTTFTSGTANLIEGGGAITIASTTGQSFKVSVPATSSLAGVNGVSISTAGNNISIGGPVVSTYVNVLPASTGSQTLGAMGVTSGSAQFYPVSIESYVQFNAVRLAMNFSYATSTASGQQTVSHSFGLYSKNGSTLSQISSNSLSYAITNSSVSASFSGATATGTGGYSYGTLTASTTAQIHSLFGTNGLRVIDLQFGDSMSVAPGMYWVGFLRRESSVNANVGLSVGIAGNVVGPMNSLAVFGSNSGALTTNFALRGAYAGFGPYTSTGSAGYGGTALPSSVFLSGIAHTASIMPFMTFIST